MLHPQPKPLRKLVPLPHPQQKKRRIIIQKELQPFPQPLLHPYPLFPSKRRRRMIIHTIELQLSPHPPHPPQFVAAKSLIKNPPIKTFTIQ